MIFYSIVNCERCPLGTYTRSMPVGRDVCKNEIDERYKIVENEIIIENPCLHFYFHLDILRYGEFWCMARFFLPRNLLP